MSSNTVDIYNPKTIRSTMGSIFRVPFVYVQDFSDAVSQCQNAGIKVYAAHLDGKNTYLGEDYREGTAFLIGNEGNGLTDDITKQADTLIRIPMQGEVESLNAAIACTILTYEAVRQKCVDNQLYIWSYTIFGKMNLINKPANPLIERVLTYLTNHCNFAIIFP